jgi:hypothetical protein
LALSPAAFSFSPAEVPPAAPPAPLVLSLLAGASFDSLFSASPLDSGVELSPVAVVDVVDVVAVEVVCAAAFSAVVSVGGVMSGVLFGTASLTLLPPPQAARPTEQSKMALAAMIARVDGRRVCRAMWCGSGVGRVLVTRVRGLRGFRPEALN